MSVSTASGISGRKRGKTFTASTTFTIPAGVYSVTVVGYGGGGGFGEGSAPGAGSPSTVVTGETVTLPARSTGASVEGSGYGVGSAGAANSGLSGTGNHYRGKGFSSGTVDPAVAYLATTPGGTATITIGAGGSSTYNGGSGIVRLEWEV
jgi:hypothetical protein